MVAGPNHQGVGVGNKKPLSVNGLTYPVRPEDYLLARRRRS